MGIPSDVTVGLAVESVTFAVTDALFQAVKDRFLAFLGSSMDRRISEGSLGGGPKIE